MSSKGKTVQARVSPIAKRAIEKHAEHVFKTKGIEMAWGDALLELLNECRPDLIQEAMKTSDEAKDKSA